VSLWRRRRNIPYSAVSPWSPITPPGCTFWFRGDGITGLVDTDPLGTWNDESGNGHDVSQGIGVSKPLYRTNIVNSLPAVYFDGINDWMDGTLSGALGDFYYFIVASSSSTSPFWLTFGNYDPLLGASAITRRSLWDTVYLEFTDLSWTNNLANFYLIEYWRTGNNYYCAQNGAPSADNPRAHVYSNTPVNFALATQTYGGYVVAGVQYQAESFLYDNFPSALNITEARLYIKNKYALW